jgi:chromosomal replication initiation ATPase DnaA
MKIARARTTLSLTQIGSIWGKHYSTIIHGLDNVKKAHETNDELYLDWENRKLVVIFIINLQEFIIIIFYL